MLTEWWRPMSDAPNQNASINNPSISQNISSYFKRPSKITKPNSRNQSPRNKTRRRMTTQFPVRTRSVVDAQRNGAISQQHFFDNTTSTRPLSWHPTFTNDYSQYQDSGCSFTYPYSQPSQYTTFAYGLVTPITYPAEVEPYTDFTTIPLDQLAEQDYRYLQDNLATTNAYQQNFTQDLATYASVPAAPTETVDYTTQPWPSIPLMNTFDVTTAPASPNYLPTPDMGQPFDFFEITDVEDEKEELVGMGLYDSPDQAQSSNLLFGSSPIQRKSLKLEESFEPPPEDFDADDAESESVRDEDDLASQDEFDQTQIDQLNQQLQQIPSFSEKAGIYQEENSYFAREFSSMEYHERAERAHIPAYGWF